MANKKYVVLARRNKTEGKLGLLRCPQCSMSRIRFTLKFVSKTNRFVCTNCGQTPGCLEKILEANDISLKRLHFMIGTKDWTGYEK